MLEQAQLRGQVVLSRLVPVHMVGRDVGDRGSRELAATQALLLEALRSGFQHCVRAAGRGHVALGDAAGFDAEAFATGNARGHAEVNGAVDGGDGEGGAAGGFGKSLQPGRRPALLVIDFVRAYLVPGSPLYAGVATDDLDFIHLTH